MPATITTNVLPPTSATTTLTPPKAKKPADAEGADFSEQLNEAKVRSASSSTTSSKAEQPAPKKAAGGKSAKPAARAQRKHSQRATDASSQTDGDEAVDGVDASDQPAKSVGDHQADDAADTADSDDAANHGAAGAKAERVADVADVADPAQQAAIPVQAVSPSQAEAPAKAEESQKGAQTAVQAKARVEHAPTDAKELEADAAPKGGARDAGQAEDVTDGTASVNEKAGSSRDAGARKEASELSQSPFDVAPEAGAETRGAATKPQAKQVAPPVADVSSANVAAVSTPQATPETGAPSSDSDDASIVASLLPDVAAGQTHAASANSTTTAQPPAAPQPAPEARFAEANHTNIVSGVRANLLPHGGTMQIRLDPPELGALSVTVEMRDGTVNATFQTSNDDATRLLSHSLGQLKTALESQGVTVEKIQVQQAPKDHSAQQDGSQQQQRDDAQSRQERQRDEQRRAMLQRMWRRVSGASDPVDLVA